MAILKGYQGEGEVITKRILTETIWKLLNVPAVTRKEYLQRYEASYNYGPAAFPPQVMIELTSQCNLKCAICQYPDMQRPQQDMDRSLARKVIDECAQNGVWYLLFQFFGEPLLCPDYLAEMTKFAKDKGIPIVTTVTNMTLMTEKIMRRWIEAGLDSLNISFEGSSPEKYKEIRDWDYYRLLENIKMARRIRDEMGLGIPFLTITLTRTDETDEELQKFYDEMLRIVDAVDIRSMMMFNYRPENSAKYEKALKGWFVKRDLQKRIPCRQIGGKLIVTAQGEVTVCCVDIDAELSLGNVKEKSLKEIWKSDAFAKIYMLHRQQRWPDLPGICRNCRDWDWEGNQPDWEARDKRWKEKEDD